MSTNYYAFTTETGPYDPDADDLMEEQGIHLCKRSVGWEPGIQKHAGEHGCPCNCSEPPYTTWDEFAMFVQRDDVTVRDEYGDEQQPSEFLEMLATWKQDNDRTHTNHLDASDPFARRDLQMTSVVDGWEFRGGHWC